MIPSYMMGRHDRAHCNGIMQLHLSTWTEVEQYLQISQAMIIPIGSTEQHSPIGLIGTDAICAEAIAKGVGEANQALVGPTINVGMALHHLAFPGSMSLKPSTMILVLRDYISSLARHGFRRFFFINGHGGNVATMKAAFAETYDYLATIGIDDVQCVVNNWYMGRSVYQLAQALYGDQEGSHATPSEVALTWYVYPEAVKTGEMMGKPGKGHAIYSAQDFRQRYPDGRMGSNPALATVEHGQQFYEAAVKEISEDYRKFIA
jgi:creatinine amidohydrolase